MYHPNHPDKDYKIANLVEVFDEPRAIAWKPGTESAETGELSFGGWTWRYDLEATSPSRTTVTLTYDWSAVPPEVREYLVDVYGADGLPFNTRFGNGDPIGEDIVALLNQVYEANTVREPWQAGDLMLVDNVRCAHSREPFDGPREVLVAMADAVRLADCSPTVEVTGR